MTTSRLNQSIFDDWLSNQPPESHQLLTDIREAIIASGHNFTEGIKWGTPGYWLPEISRRNIVYIAPHKNYVRLGFFNGATMPDPQNLLEGTGKKLRHIKIHNLSSPFRKAKGARTSEASARGMPGADGRKGRVKRSRSAERPAQSVITPQTLTTYVNLSTQHAIQNPESLSS